MSGARERAVQQLFAAEYARLAAWCSALSGDPDLGEELAQEAFVRLLGRWHTIRQPRPFLYTVAANLVNDRWQQQRRGRSLLRLLAVTAPPSVPGPDGGVRDLIRRLPERQRLAVLLHYYGGLSLAEVAEQLDKPEGTVRRWAAEGRATLRAQLEEVR